MGQISGKMDVLGLSRDLSALAELFVGVVALNLPAQQQILRTMARREQSRTLPPVLVNVIQLVIAVDYRLYSR